MRALERRAGLLRVLRSALDERSAFVWIGEENPAPELRSVSVVGANYGLGYRNLGTVGVVGPLRMDYETAISSVREAATELSRFFETRLRGLVPCRATSTRSSASPREADGRRDQEGVPPPRPRAASRRQPARPRGRGEVQGGRRGLRGALRSRAPADLRRLRPRGPAVRRLGARTPPTSAASRTSWARSSAAATPCSAISSAAAGAGRLRAATCGASVEITLDEVRHRRQARGRVRRRRDLRALSRQRRRAGDADPRLRDVRRRGRAARGRAHRVRAGDADRRLRARAGARGRSRRSPCEECAGRGQDREAAAPSRSRSRPGSSRGQRIRVSGPATPATRRAGRQPLRRGRGHARRRASSATASICVTVARISATRAMLGGEVTVPTLDGERAVERPGGRPARRAVVLDGAGLPDAARVATRRPARGARRGGPGRSRRGPARARRAPRRHARRRAARQAPSERGEGRRWGRRRRRARR